jgi:cell division protein ZapA
MATVTITIHGRPYPVACDDGEEAHLQSLADTLDARVAELAGIVGPVGEARLLLMAGLLLSDETQLQAERVAALEAEVEALRAGGSAEVRARIEQSEETVAMVLESAARRIEDLVRRVG